MASGRKKQILALLKWRKGKKQKTEKEEVVTPDDIDFGSNQQKQMSSLFGRSQSEDSGLDLSNSSYQFQKNFDALEHTSIHSRKISTSSDPYSDLSYDSRTVLLPRTYSFTALSGGQHEPKATASSSEEDDDFFGLKDIIQTINSQYSLPESRETAKSDFADVTKSEIEEGKKHRLSSNNWRNENKWKTKEERVILRRHQTILGFHEQVKKSSFRSKSGVSGPSNTGMGILYRICNMMEKITELERDRMVLLRQNNELQHQLSQSQQTEVTFLSCCTCGAGAKLSASHIIPRQTICSRQMLTRNSPITEVKSQVSLGPSSEASAVFEQFNSSQPTFTDVASTFTQKPLETLNLESESDQCVSRV
ncbi:uncharacterized protein LOC122556903 [Chiloscyllium plagiosum]|uniref:uncharacterized protein LOC122556903 n=1 Tax=Chiloscyllium plagiosum TaxID=36176 RepID=UPI001CB84ACB|nr:uncharacterized protein LOC122556903 [Chiloscyllium plagiosum]